MLETIACPVKPITAPASAMFAVACNNAAPATVAIAAILMSYQITARDFIGDLVLNIFS